MGGPWADHRFGTAPIFKILGYVIGIGAPINALVRIIRDYNRELKQDPKSDEQQRDEQQRPTQHD
jgi:F0F1-type ATP synthase assembly protein I